MQAVSRHSQYGRLQTNRGLISRVLLTLISTSVIRGRVVVVWREGRRRVHAPVNTGLARREAAVALHGVQLAGLEKDDRAAAKRTPKTRECGDRRVWWGSSSLPPRPATRLGVRCRSSSWKYVGVQVLLLGRRMMQMSLLTVWWMCILRIDWLVDVSVLVNGLIVAKQEAGRRTMTPQSLYQLTCLVRCFGILDSGNAVEERECVAVTSGLGSRRVHEHWSRTSEQCRMRKEMVRQTRAGIQCRRAGRLEQLESAAGVVASIVGYSQELVGCGARPRRKSA